LLERGCVRVSATARACVAPQRLHGEKRFVALEMPDDAPECGGKASNVFVERKIFRASGRSLKQGSGS
jgi:hypothetical protein